MGVVAAMAIAMAIAGATAAWADVTLTPQQRENLGVRTTELGVSAVAKSLRATGQVLDVGTLTGNLADLRAAKQALAASDAEVRRTGQLFKDDVNVARKTLEAAQSQRALDEARVTTLEGQIRSTWGAALGANASLDADRLARELGLGKTVLVRIDLPSPVRVTRTRPTVQLRSLDGELRWPATWLGELPRGAGATLGGTVLVRTAASLQAGQLLLAEISESETSVPGMRIPATAIVRWRGSEWFYVESEDNHFERRSLKEAVAIQAERIVPAEANAALRVVDQGARALLAAELDTPDE